MRSLLVICACVFNIDGTHADDKKPDKRDLPVLAVSVPVVRKVTEHLELTGRTDAKDSVAIVPRVTGYITGNRSPVFDFHEIRDYKEGRKAGICQPIFSCLPAFLIKLSFL